ncbi:MAG: ABC transporter ATP-binding protein [Thermodesulfobacteriota bacterium]|nr:ABC transporter ATP-binding protein [Thermodesulfobacteriota bacterium]
MLEPAGAKDPLSSRRLSGKTLVLEIDGLRKTFTNNGLKVEVLKDLKCSIYSGEIIGVVGASGVGKTTFLHILGTLDCPTSGKIFHFGENVFSWKDTKLSKFRNEELGFVFQFHHLLPEFSALENVMMPCFVAGESRPRAKELARDILAEFGLETRFDHRVGQLSGGEQQRVALARAMVRKPRLLLADEPTGNLDERTGEKAAELIFTLNKRYGTTVVVVTHNLALASRMDRCIGLAEGRAMELNAPELKNFGVGRIS